jgi:signal peptidase I
MRFPWSRRDEDAPPEQGKAKKEAKSLPHQIIEFVVIIAVALGLALLIQAFLVKPYRIPSGSMEPTLKIGQRVLVNRLGNNFGNPSVGDIIVFHPPAGAANNDAPCGVRITTDEPCPKSINKEDTSTNFIKRLVAGPGDTIKIINGHLYRNGVREKDGYIRPCMDNGDTCDLPHPVKIPPGHWFMMGDNRGASDDSRFWGAIPRSWIIGQAFFTYWPPSRIGFL